MNYKRILLYGRDFYKYIISNIEKTISSNFYITFWFNEFIFEVYDKNSLNVNKINLNKNNLENGDYEKAFDKHLMVKFLIENIIKDDEFLKYFDNIDFQIDKIFKEAKIDEILNNFENLTLYKTFIKTKNHLLIYFSHQTKAFFENNYQNEDFFSNREINFYLDEIKNKYEEKINNIFYKWFKSQAKIYEYFFNRFELLKIPIENYYKDKVNVEFDEEKLHFNDIKNVLSENEVESLYLQVHKSDFIKYFFIKSLRNFDSIYNLSEFSLFDETLINEIFIQNYFGDNKFNFDEDKNILNFDNKFNSKYFKIQNNFETLSYYPNLKNIIIFEDSSITSEVFDLISKNASVSEVDYFYYGEKPILIIEDSEKFHFKINFKHIGDFFPELNKAIEKIQKSNSLKYSFNFNESFNVKNQIVYKISYKNNFKNLINNFNINGGYVSTMFNLSQLDKSTIMDDSVLLDYSYVFGNANVVSGAVIQDHVIIADNVNVSNSLISKNAIILENSQITNSFVTDNAFIYANTLVTNFSTYYPSLKGNVKIGLKEGVIKGNVIISEYVQIKGIVHINGEDFNPSIIKGNAYIDNSLTTNGNITIKDNAILHGDIFLYDSVEIFGNANLYGKIVVHHNSKIYDNAIIGSDDTKILISGDSEIFQNSKILNDSMIFSKSKIFGNNLILSKTKFINTKFYANITLNNNLKHDYVFKKIIFNDNWIQKLKNQNFFEYLIDDINLSSHLKVNKKYKITRWRKSVWNEKTNKAVAVYRIQATQNFSDIKKLEYGGYIENLENLDENGKSWIYDDAVVYGNAKVIENAKVYNMAIVSDNAIVSQNSIIKNSAIIRDSAIIMGASIISQNAIVGGVSIITSKVKIRDNALIEGNSLIFDNVIVKNNSHIDNAKITENSIVSKTSFIKSGYINNSLIDGDITIKNSSVFNSVIYDSVVLNNSMMNNSRADNISNISYSIVEKSFVTSKATLINSRITSSIIFDNSRIANSLLKHTIVKHFSNVESSFVYESNLNNFTQFKHSFVQNSIVSDKSNIYESIVKFSKINHFSNIERSKVLLSIINGESELKDSVVINSQIFETNYIKKSLIKNTKIIDFNVFLNKTISSEST